MRTTSTPTTLSGNHTATTAFSSTYPGNVGDLEKQSNEALYASLVANETPLSEGLEVLVHRLRPIIFNIARDYEPHTGRGFFMLLPLQISYAYHFMLIRC